MHIAGAGGRIERMPDASEITEVAPSLQNWLSQGEQLYAAALTEFRALEAQLDDLEHKLAAKQLEVNQIAQIIGKPGVEGTRRLSAQLTPPPQATVVEGNSRLPVPMPGGAPPSNSA